MLHLFFIPFCHLCSQLGYTVAARSSFFVCTSLASFSDTDSTVCSISHHLNPLNHLHHEAFSVQDYLISIMLF